MRPVLVAKTNYIQGVLDIYGGENKTLYNSEVALLCGGPFDPPGGDGCEAEDTSPFEIMKTAYAAQAYAAAMAKDLTGNIWYSITGSP